MSLYVNLAELLGTRIEQGFYRPGDRLPSVRALSVEHGVSLSTVQQAYRLLEDNGLALPKPKSGYFVPASRELPALPVVGRPAQRPVEISQWDHVLELIRVVPHKDTVQLGRGIPDIGSPTMKPLLRSLAQISRRQDLPGLGYDNIYGNLGLREQIARLLLDSGCQLEPPGPGDHHRLPRSAIGQHPGHLRTWRHRRGGLTELPRRHADPQGPGHESPGNPHRSAHRHQPRRP